MIWIIIGSILIIVALGMGVHAAGMIKRVIDIKHYKTSRVIDVVETYQQLSKDNTKYKGGVVELVGTGFTNTPLVAEHSKQEVLFYRAQIIREYKETVIVREQDEDGNYTTREEIKHRSETVSDNSYLTSFYLDDGSGASIKVEMKGATRHPIRSMNSFKRQGGIFDNNHHSTTKGYRYIEDIIPNHVRLYILGQTYERHGELVVMHPAEDNNVEFIISTKSEEELIRDTNVSATLSIIGGVLLLLGGIALIVYGAVNYGN